MSLNGILQGFGSVQLLALLWPVLSIDAKRLQTLPLNRARCSSFRAAFENFDGLALGNHRKK